MLTISFSALANLMLVCPIFYRSGRPMETRYSTRLRPMPTARVGYCITANLPNDIVFARTGTPPDKLSKEHSVTTRITSTLRIEFKESLYFERGVSCFHLPVKQKKSDRAKIQNHYGFPDMLIVMM